HKYGPDLDAVLRFHDQACADRDALERLDHDAELLTAESEALETELTTLSAVITAARARAAARLTSEIAPLLHRLGMRHAEFVVSLSEASRRSAHGSDLVEFSFSANAGEAKAPLAQIASGGELSRVMLALNLVTGTTQQTVAFD